MRAFKRPVDHECSALDIILRYKSPRAAILAVVTVIAHRKIVSGRDSYRTKIFGRQSEELGFVYFVGFLDWISVDVNLLVPNFQFVVSQTDYPLDEITSRIFRVFENDDIRALDVPDGQEIFFPCKICGRVGEFVNQDVVPDQQVVFHGTAGYFECFDHKSSEK